MTRPLLLAVSACLALACTRGAEPTAAHAPPGVPGTLAGSTKGGPGATASATATAPATPSAPAGPMVEVPKLALKAPAPPGTIVEDALVGEGVMLRGPGVEVSIEEAGESRPQSLDEARKDVDHYAPQNVQVESLPDGFAITFEAEGGMGRNYWLEARRTLGDKAFWCESSTPRPEARAGGLAVCKGLVR